LKLWAQVGTVILHNILLFELFSLKYNTNINSCKNGHLNQKVFWAQARTGVLKGHMIKVKMLKQEYT
jgi:hypothetical protein